MRRGLWRLRGWCGGRCVCGVLIFRAARAQGGLRPGVNDAADRCWDELLGACVDETDYLCPGRFVEAASFEDFGDLAAELSIGAESGVDFFADGGGEALREGCAASGLELTEIGESLLESAIDRGTDGAFEVGVGGLLEGGVGAGELRVDCGLLLRLRGLRLLRL